MFTSVNTSLSKGLGLRLICAAVVLLSVALGANAQGVGSSRGLASGGSNNTIQGRVYFPSGERSDKIIKLRLESNDSIGGLSTVTDQDGAFRFNGVAPGNYAVVVEGGKDYESPREPVTI